jgi:muramoyltetrapeptide carboxypeptidase
MFDTPPRLAPGDRVSIVAPSGPFARERFEAGIAAIRETGLEPVFDDRLFTSHRYLAGDDGRRRLELVAALQDQSTRAIWTARGGYGATRIAPELDPQRVRAAGKWLIGFSDATALHALWARAGLASVHGANVTTLADWSAEARAELFAILFAGRAPLLAGDTAHGSAPVSGRLLGGNLTVLAAMAGTGQLPPSRGAVWLLEDVGERPYRLDRSLTQLRQAGALDGASGYVIGQLTGCTEPGGVEVEYDALDVVASELLQDGVPLLSGVQVGHEASSRAALLGSRVLLDPVHKTVAPILDA